jgi:hypothetical protein
MFWMLPAQRLASTPIPRCDRGNRFTVDQVQLVQSQGVLTDIFPSQRRFSPVDIVAMKTVTVRERHSQGHGLFGFLATSQWLLSPGGVVAVAQTEQVTGSSVRFAYQRQGSSCLLIAKLVAMSAPDASRRPLAARSGGRTGPAQQLIAGLITELLVDATSSRPTQNTATRHYRPFSVRIGRVAVAVADGSWAGEVW